MKRQNEIYTSRIHWVLGGTWSLKMRRGTICLLWIDKSTGLCGGLEHRKIKTRLIDERFPSVMGECVIVTTVSSSSFSSRGSASCSRLSARSLACNSCRMASARPQASVSSRFAARSAALRLFISRFRWNKFICSRIKKRRKPRVQIDFVFPVLFCIFFLPCPRGISRVSALFLDGSALWVF